MRIPENKMSDDKLLRKKDAANLLAVSVRTIERMVCSGRLVRVMVRGGVRLRESEVLAIVNCGAL